MEVVPPELVSALDALSVSARIARPALVVLASRQGEVLGPGELLREIREILPHMKPTQVSNLNTCIRDTIEILETRGIVVPISRVPLDIEESLLTTANVRSGWMWGSQIESQE